MKARPAFFVVKQIEKYFLSNTKNGSFPQCNYHKDIEHLYHAYVYSPVSLLSGIYSLPAMHSLLVTSDTSHGSYFWTFYGSMLICIFVKLSFKKGWVTLLANIECNNMEPNSSCTHLLYEDLSKISSREKWNNVELTL